MAISPNKYIPIRYIPFVLCILAAIASFATLELHRQAFQFMLIFGFLSLVGIYDLLQTKIAILRNYPVIGHLRLMLEFIRPEIRQYFI